MRIGREPIEAAFTVREIECRFWPASSAVLVEKLLMRTEADDMERRFGNNAAARYQASLELQS